MNFVTKVLMLATILIASVECIANKSYTETVSLSDGKVELQVETLIEGLDYPWALAFLPDNRLLISERSGQLRQFKDGKLLAPVKNVPPVLARGQGGLHDIALHPDFINNNELFISFAHGTISANTTRVIRAKLVENQLENIRVIFDVEPYKDTPVHYGGRLVVLPDNTLLLTTGDGFDYREQAQQKDSLLGKVVRINFDGGIPRNNPFFADKQAKKAIWTLGHRNPQGLIYDPVRNQVFLHEHGPRGGDEINLLNGGNNYGWPVATFGKDYSGATISPYTEYKGMTQPLLHWTPSIAPSGFAVYYGKEFPEFNGDFLVGALAGRELRLVEMDGGSVKQQVSLLKPLNHRIRDVRVNTDGVIYVLTDSSNGALLKLTQIKSQ